MAANRLCAELKPKRVKSFEPGGEQASLSDATRSATDHLAAAETLERSPWILQADTSVWPNLSISSGN